MQTAGNRTRCAWENSLGSNAWEYDIRGDTLQQLHWALSEDENTLEDGSVFVLEVTTPQGKLERKGVSLDRHSLDVTMPAEMNAGQPIVGTYRWQLLRNERPEVRGSFRIDGWVDGALCITRAT